MSLLSNGNFDGGHNPAKLPYDASLLTMMRFERIIQRREVETCCDVRLSDMLLLIGLEQPMLVAGGWAI